MLLELFDQFNYQSYNVSIAKMFDINTAIYLEVLLSIQRKALSSKVKYFSIDPEYVRSKTTLGKVDQKKCKEMLINAGVLLKSSDDKFEISTSTITSLFLDEDETVKASLNKLKANANKRTKSECILDKVKGHIRQDLPIEIIKAYEDWLDMNSINFHKTSVEMIESAQREIESATNGDGNLTLQLIKYATANCYKDMKYAVQVYKERYGLKNDNNSLRGNVVMENVEVKKDMTF